MQFDEQIHYTYRPSPVQDGAFQIFIKPKGSAQEIYYGDYTLLDYDEDQRLTEMKVLNLISVLNGREDLVDLSELSAAKMMYQHLPEDAQGYKQILFRTYDGQGMSEENAIFRYVGGNA